MENLPQFNLVDIIALLYIALITLRGLARGLSGELARLLSAAAAVAAGLYFYEPFGRVLLQYTRLGEWGGERTAFGVAFALLLIGGWLAMRALRFLLRHLMEFTFRGRIERVGGMLAGFLRASVVAGAVILLLGLAPQEDLRQLFVEESLLGRHLARYALPAYDELAEKFPALRIPARKEAADVEEVEAEEQDDTEPAEESE
ncbi:MAG: CvpA family protein [Verrucomicrobia bacterium]|nr:CvpA family protein [Verrucomicrobiota bacterium]